MNKPQIFKAEIEDGLQEKILASASVTTASCLEIAEAFDVKEFRTIAENKDQVDLYYLKSILVTTGWNKNDDVFIPAEMWLARHSPEDKPFNFEHDQKQIIGHITSCEAITNDGNVIADDTSINELPNKFHILTSAVLYKIWEDSKKQMEMDNIISEIAQGKWFVSMEALFTNFDYAIMDGDKYRVVARNEDTAFLSRYLRAYGGSGVYNNVKIGRILKSIVFSGNGLVRNPANPESVILKQTEGFKSNSGYVLSETVQAKENDTMNENEIAEMQKQIENLNASLVKANENIEVCATEAGLWAKEKEEMNQKLAEANKMIEDLKTAHESALSELGNMKKEKKTNDRLNYVMEKMGMSKDEAINVVNSLEPLDDKSFSSAVDTHSEYMNKKMGEYKSSKSDNVEVECNPDPSTHEIEEDPAEAKASTSVLDTAEVKLDAALATSEGNSAVDQVASQIASYFGLDKSVTE